MVLGAEVAERGKGGRSDEPAATEVIKLILGLGRPVLCEQVFEAGADGEAVAMAAIERERNRSASERHAFVVVRKCIAALGVQQGRTPGVANAAGHGAERALVVGVNESAG